MSPRTATIFEQFLQKLEEYTVGPKLRNDRSGRPFVLISKLREWLNPLSQALYERNIAKLFEAAYEKNDMDPVKLEDVIGGDHPCLYTFCILLELKRPDLLRALRRCRVHDALLPIDLQQLERKLTTELKGYHSSVTIPKTEASELAAQFNDAQWKYFPVEFKEVDSQALEKPRILPFIDRQIVSRKGATANVQQVVVPEHFVQGKLRQLAGTPGPEHPDYKHVGPCYRFALKVFQDGNKRLFDRETDAYRALQDNKGMIKYLGDYSHVEGTVATHNILLEYADFDLAEYFRYRTPPLLTKQIEKFWNDLFRIPKAIHQLHDFETKRLNTSQKLQGWHADIKPDNILLVREEFKLADPGFAKFRRPRDGAQLGVQDGTVITGGTQTYGAPERYDPDTKITDPSSIDMWSFGCVLSEAATWVVLGGMGQEQFAVLRQQAIDRLVKSGTCIKALGKGDFFHDGEDVLKEIKEWHDFLRQMLRPTDRVTDKILDLVDQYLLQRDPKHRIKAKKLCEKWSDIQKDLRIAPIRAASTNSIIENAINSATDSLLDALEKWTREADSQDLQTRKTVSTNNLFLQVQGPPGATSSFIGRSSLHSRSQLPPPVHPDGIAAPSIENGSDPHRLKDSSSITTRPLNNRDDSLDSIHIYASNPAPASGVPKVSIFDGHYESLARGQFLKSMLKRNEKNPRLAAHIENRDLLFLVDNADSMLEHWSEAIFVLEVLSAMSVNLDSDGIDIRFTTGGVKASLGKRPESKKIKETMLKKHAKPEKGRGAHTDMSQKLSELLNTWINRNAQLTKPKYLTIIVLTDGIWEGMRNKKLAVDEVIIEYDENLKQKAGTLLSKNVRPVSIQFISFGNNPDALYRLKRLDDELKWSGVPDIVDTEPSTGDVYQMLLGSIRDDLDGQNDVVPGGESSISHSTSRVNSLPSNYNGAGLPRHERSMSELSQGSRPSSDYHPARSIGDQVMPSIMRTLHE